MLITALSVKGTYQFFRALPIKIYNMKINHIWTKISYSTPYEAHLKKQRVSVIKKLKNAVKSQNFIFTKIT